MLKDQENSIKAFKKVFQLPKVKSPQKEEEEKETKYTLAFHAEGKKISYVDQICRLFFSADIVHKQMAMVV